VTPDPPRSRRERPAKPALSREAIVEAAWDILQAEGLDKLTMRALAARLDTGPASLYVYVRNVAEVHALLIDRQLAQLDLRWNGRTDPRTRLRRLLVAYAEILMEHPGLARSAQVTWPAGPHYLDLLELILRLLQAAGASAPQAAWGVDLLLQIATAMAAEHATRGQSGTDDPVAHVTSQLANANPSRHRQLTALGPQALTAGPPNRRRDWSLDAAINGVLTTPRNAGNADPGQGVRH